MENESKRQVAIRVFAEHAKKNYRELLTYRKFAALLKEGPFGNPAVVEGILADARESPDVLEAANSYDAMIDAKTPPSPELFSEEALRKALEALPPTEFPN